MAATYVARLWSTFEKAVMPADVSVLQRQEMRRAFFAGAGGLFDLITLGVSEGDEVAESDLKMMSDIRSELDRWLADLKRGRG